MPIQNTKEQDIYDFKNRIKEEGGKPLFSPTPIGTPIVDVVEPVEAIENQERFNKCTLINKYLTDSKQKASLYNPFLQLLVEKFKASSADIKRLKNQLEIANSKEMIVETLNDMTIDLSKKEKKILAETLLNMQKAENSTSQKLESAAMSQNPMFTVLNIAEDIKIEESVGEANQGTRYINLVESMKDNLGNIYPHLDDEDEKRTVDSLMESFSSKKTPTELQSYIKETVSKFPKNSIEYNMLSGIYKNLQEQNKEIPDFDNFLEGASEDIMADSTNSQAYENIEKLKAKHNFATLLSLSISNSLHAKKTTNTDISDVLTTMGGMALPETSAGGDPFVADRVEAYFDSVLEDPSVNKLFNDKTFKELLPRNELTAIVSKLKTDLATDIRKVEIENQNNFIKKHKAFVETPGEYIKDGHHEILQLIKQEQKAITEHHSGLPKNSSERTQLLSNSSRKIIQDYMYNELISRMAIDKDLNNIMDTVEKKEISPEKKEIVAKSITQIRNNRSKPIDIVKNIKKNNYEQSGSLKEIDNMYAIASLMDLSKKLSENKINTHQFAEEIDKLPPSFFGGQEQRNAVSDAVKHLSLKNKQAFQDEVAKNSVKDSDINGYLYGEMGHKLKKGATLNNMLNHINIQQRSVADLDNCLKASSNPSRLNDTTASSAKDCIKKYMDDVEKVSRTVEDLAKNPTLGATGMSAFLVLLHLLNELKKRKAIVLGYNAERERLAMLQSILSGKNETEKTYNAYSTIAKKEKSHVKRGIDPKDELLHKNAMLYSSFQMKKELFASDELKAGINSLKLASNDWETKLAEEKGIEKIFSKNPRIKKSFDNFLHEKYLSGTSSSPEQQNSLQELSAKITSTKEALSDLEQKFKMFQSSPFPFNVQKHILNENKKLEKEKLDLNKKLAPLLSKKDASGNEEKSISRYKRRLLEIENQIGKNRENYQKIKNDDGSTDLLAQYRDDFRKSIGIARRELSALKDQYSTIIQIPAIVKREDFQKTILVKLKSMDKASTSQEKEVIGSEIISLLKTYGANEGERVKNAINQLDVIATTHQSKAKGEDKELKKLKEMVVLLGMENEKIESLNKKDITDNLTRNKINIYMENLGIEINSKLSAENKTKNEPLTLMQKLDKKRQELLDMANPSRQKKTELKKEKPSEYLTALVDNLADADNIDKNTITDSFAGKVRLFEEFQNTIELSSIDSKVAFLNSLNGKIKSVASSSEISFLNDLKARIESNRPLPGEKQFENFKNSIESVVPLKDLKLLDKIKESFFSSRKPKSVREVESIVQEAETLVTQKTIEELGSKCKIKKQAEAYDELYKDHLDVISDASSIDMFTIRDKNGSLISISLDKETFPKDGLLRRQLQALEDATSSGVGLDSSIENILIDGKKMSSRTLVKNIEELLGDDIITKDAFFEKNFLFEARDAYINKDAYKTGNRIKL